ncbi:hypothetical protein [Arsukibacterium sp.]|uniref:hypothetical protein n=1 Tax=Arsukibacterium sp. TaxID=1977258 RepID=UPI001BD2786D|nr:hypothetical protein [Arsukibacterium sp.]
MEHFTKPHLNQNALRRGVKTASGRLHRAIDDATDAAVPVFKKMTGRAQYTANRVAEGAHLAAGAISHKGEQLHHLQQQLVRSSRTKIRNRPLLAVGIAVAGGLLLSWWLTRNSSQQDTE